MSEAIHDVLHNGDPVVGWAGDPHLTMTHSNVHGWELWRNTGVDEWELVARQVVPNAPLDLTKLVKELARRDSHGSRGVSHEAVIQDFLEASARTNAEKERKMADALYEPTAKATDAVLRAAGARNKVFW